MSVWKPQFTTMRLMLWIAIFAVTILVPARWIHTLKRGTEECESVTAPIWALGGSVETSPDGEFYGASGVIAVFLSDGLASVYLSEGLTPEGNTTAPIGDGDLERLKEPLSRMSNLQRLHLNSGSITDRGLVHLQCLAQNSNLHMLTLGGTQVTDVGLIHLQALTQLSKLDLTNSAVTPAGAKDLKKALAKTRIRLGKEEF